MIAFENLKKNQFKHKNILRVSINCVDLCKWGQKVKKLIKPGSINCSNIYWKTAKKWNILWKQCGENIKIWANS